MSTELDNQTRTDLDDLAHRLETELLGLRINWRSMIVRVNPAPRNGPFTCGWCHFRISNESMTRHIARCKTLYDITDAELASKAQQALKEVRSDD